MKFRPATLDEYVHWLRGYIANGGKLGYYRDRPFESGDYLVAKRHFTMEDECGSRARTILVPEGVRVSGPQGHNRLLFFDGYRLQGRSSGPEVFDDEIFRTLLGVIDFINAKKAREHAWHQENEARDSARKQWAERSDIGRYTGQTDSRRTRRNRWYRAPARDAVTGPANVYVKAGKVIVVPATMPLAMSLDEAEALAEQIRAAAAGARQSNPEEA